MKKLPSVHSLFESKGTPRACGRQYGENQAEAIEAFLHLEVAPDAKRLGYARRCWKKLENWERHVAEFTRGLAEGSRLSIEEAVLLLLHEEISHTKHCTAIGATGRGTKDGTAIVGQNWDWDTRLYPWAGLTRLQMSGAPHALFYSYPGLWACAGMNQHGLSLVWTSSGGVPKVANPTVGIPTYALIPGLLGKRTCAEALDLLRRTPFAGAFIFLMADARKEVWVIEGCRGRFDAIRCRDAVTRANHYEGDKAIRRSRQKIDPDPNAKGNSWHRGCRAADLAVLHRGKIDGAAVERILGDEGVGPGKNICQRPTAIRRGMTLDSFYCLPSRREFRIARGIPIRHEYKRYGMN